MAWRSVSNMVIPKIKVTNGMVWRPVSDSVSPKGVLTVQSQQLRSKFFFKKQNFKLLNFKFQIVPAKNRCLCCFLLVFACAHFCAFKICFLKKINRLKIVSIASITYTTRKKSYL